MSIVAAVYLPEGIVIAGDSRLTGNKTVQIGEKEVKKEFTVSDNSQKVLLLSKVKVGVVFCGNAMIDGNTIADYIRLFEIEKIEEGDTIIDVANKLYNCIKDKGIEFLVCGYENDIPYVYDVDSELVRKNIDSNGNILYRASWRGRTKAITRLLNSQPNTVINWNLMPLKDGIDFAEFIVDTTINYERFEDDIQTCGGPVDILVINKDDAFWYRHKIYKP